LTNKLGRLSGDKIVNPPRKSAIRLPAKLVRFDFEIVGETAIFKLQTTSEDMNQGRVKSIIRIIKNGKNGSETIT